MTDDPELSLILDRWLSDGPAEMPDRVIVAVATNISRQRQRPAWRLDWRHLPMTTTVKLATAIAVIAIVAVVGYTLIPGLSTGVGGPAPTTIPTATPIVTPPPPSPAESRLLHPFVAPDEALGVHVLVPENWTQFDSWAILGPSGTSAPDGIGFGLAQATSLFSDPCHPSDLSSETGDEPVGPTVDDLANALAAHKGYVASTPTPVSIGGYSGKRIDLQLPDLASCSTYFVFAHPGGTLYAQGPNNIWHLWILDVAGSRVIALYTEYAGTPPAQRALAEGMINAMTFER